MYTLYYSFMYPILVYGSSVLNPYVRSQIEMLENLSHKLLSYAFRTANPVSYKDRDFWNIYWALCWSLLFSWLKLIDIIFAFKILANIIDCNESLASFKCYILLKLLRRLRCYFYTDTLKSAFELPSPVTRISLVCNANMD